MKIYVDEMPKSCWECPCFKNDIEWNCGLDDGTNDYYLDDIDGGKCPFQSLAEHEKQVRKQVVEEIRKLAKKEFEFVVCDECCNTICDNFYITSFSLTKILDQVERSEKDEKS